MEKRETMRTKAIMIVSMLLLITGVGSLYAQAETYTLEKSINTALQNNTELKVAVMRIDSAESVVDEYFGYALPSLDFNASFSHFIQKPVMPFPDFETLLTNATYNILFEEGLVQPFQLPAIETKLQSFALANNFSTELSLSQVLFSSAVFRGIGASQVYKNITQHQLKTTIAKTVNNVTSAFNGALLSKEMLGIL